MKTLNFNNVKKRYMTVVLADEKNTTLMVGTPTKAIMDDLFRLQDSIGVLSADTTNTEAIAELFDACAKILSHNKTGHKITSEYLAETFDFEDVMLLFTSYMEFVGEVTNAKN